MKKIALIFFLSISTLVFAQQYEYEIFNTSVNSKDAELGVTYLNSKTVLFASSKKTEDDKAFSKNRRQNNRQLFIELYQGILNENGDIIQTGKFSKETNNMFFISDITFTKDLKTTYFTWNNYYNTTSRKDSTKWKTLHIVKASLNQDYEVSNIMELPFSSEEYSIMQPELSKDGKQLYFVSDMPNGYGETDIYVVDIHADGTFGTPKNLGPNINTPSSEAFPFITENTLYFSSYGHNSKGGIDTFKSELINGEFQKSIGLPDPINTKYDDFAFVIDKNSNSGFFSSDRKKGKGDADIYGFKIIEKEIECIQLITGIILNNNTNKPIENVNLKIFNSNNEALDSLNSAKDGSYKFKLKCNETYKIIAHKEHYISNEITFETNDTLDAEINKNIHLDAIPCVQQIKGVITDAITNQLIENSSIKLYQQGNLISQTTTQTNALYNFELNCNSDYIIIVNKEGFYPKELKISTNANYDEVLSKDLKLTPLPCNQILSGVVLNNVTKEPLINSELKIYKNETLVSSEILRSRSNFKIELECEASYKISAQKEGFEPFEITIITDKQFDYNFAINLELLPIECNQEITGTFSNKNTNELLTNVTVKLFKNNQLIDSQLIEGNKNYSFKVDCNESYKIIAEKEGFETFEIPFKTDSKNNNKLNKNIAFVPLPCNQLITGVITNSETGELLANTTLKLIFNGTVIKTTKTDSNSEFNFNIECDKTYVITAQKDGFIDNKITINTNNQFDLEFTENIALTPIECNQLISGTFSNKNTNELLTNVTVKLFKNNQLIDSQLIEGNKNYSFKVDCNESYKIIAEKEGFETSEITFKTDSKNNKNLNKNIVLNPIICKQFFTGIIVDEITGNRLNNLQISLFENNNLIETINLKTLEFKADLNCNTSYKLLVEKTNYLNTEITFSTDSSSNVQLEKIIKLIPKECKQVVTGTILDKNTNLPVASGNITIYANNSKVNEVLVTANGQFELSLDCSLDYNIIVNGRGYQSNSFIINKTKKYDEIITKTIYLNSQEEFKFVRNQKMVKTEPLYFDLNKDEITQIAAIELDKVVAILQNYPTIRIEIKSHTDSRAPDDYNLELSNKRAASIISYIVSKGIDPERIFGKGYGETELVNGCSNGVKCTENEHQLNRRTEFIVIEE